MKHIKTINTFVCTLLLLTLSINCLTASKFSRKYTPKLFDEDVNTRKETIAIINMMGPEAKVATNDLIKLFRQDRDADVRRMVIEALGAIKGDMGEKELNYTFLLAMNDEDNQVRYAAIATIEELEVIPVNLIPYLQKRLSDADPLVRDVTMRTFQRLERLGIRTLIGALKYPEMRMCACITLGRLGKADRLNERDYSYAVKELEKIQENGGDEELKLVVTQTLKDISKEDISMKDIPKEDTSKEDISEEDISK